MAVVRVSRAAAGTDAAADESACGGAELGGPRVEASGGVVMEVASGMEVAGMAADAADAAVVEVPDMDEASDTRLL